MEKKYTALRTIGNIYKILGIIVGAITLLLALFVCGGSLLGGTLMDGLSQGLGDTGGFGFFGGLFGGLLMGLFVIIYGGGLGITLYAAGEGIYLLLALEENTRATAALLRERS